MIKTYFRKIEVRIFSIAFAVVAAFSANAQTSTGTQTFSAQGYDDDPTTITVNTSSDITVNQGMPIQGITISDFFGGSLWGDDFDCGDWYGFTLNVDGVDVVIDGCAADFIGQDLTGAAVITVVSSDLDAWGDGIEINLELEVVYDTPACPSPVNAIISALTSSSMDVAWDAGGTETSWNVEWGAPGFTQGNGIGTQTVSSASVSIPGLSANTTYEVRIVADCGAGEESYPLTVFVLTACDAIPAVAFCEGFEADSPAWNCWSIIDGNGDAYIDNDPVWGYTDYIWTVNNYEANTGLQSAYIYANDSNDDYLISPPLILTGNEVMTFSYMTESGFKVLISTTGSNPSDFTDELLDITTYTDYEYVETSVDLSTYSGEVYIAFYVNSTTYNYVHIDDVCVDICTPNPGTDGTADVCRLDNTIDLSTVITSEYTHGEWQNEDLQSLVNGSSLNVSPLGAGSYTFNYIVTTACTSDTTSAIITIFNPSSAGENGIITTCKNQMIDLFGGLEGTIDAGGTWYDPNGTALSGSYFSSGNLVGQKVYKYIVDNGVCDADTAEVLVDVQNCDFLGLEDAVLENVSLYPNPTNGLFHVAGIPANEGFKIEVSDLNGRVVRGLEDVHSSTTIIDLTDLQDGVYLVRLSGNESEKTVRVIKQ